MPIPGTTKRDRLEENIGAASVELSKTGPGDIEAAVSKIDIQGVRYWNQIIAHKVQ